MLVLLMWASAGCITTRSSGVATSTAAFPKGTGFIRHSVTVDGKPHVVWLFVPRNYKPTKSYPAIVFLHGLFESGATGERCLSAGLGPVIAKSPQDWPFITIFPQSTGTWRGDMRDRLVMRALDDAQARWSIDRNRVILAGLSFGGLGTWEIGARHPERFAALVPISGIRAADQVSRLTGVPVWAFSYSNDIWVDSSNSEYMCEQIRRRGGKARITEFAGIGHDGWGRAIHDSDLVKWMLAQKRSAPATPTAGTASLAQIE